MADEDVSVKFGANIDEFVKNMQQLGSVISKNIAGIKQTVEGLGTSFEKLSGIFIATAAVLAGGAAFKETVDEAVKFTDEATRLSKALGINTTEASALNIALGDLTATADGSKVSAESYIAVNNALTRQVRTNEQALKDMGVATRDSNGNFNDARTLMTSALQVLGEYKEGTDRNIASQVLFRKAGEDAIKLLQLNNQVLEEARKKQEDLNLVVGQQSVENTREYKAAMNEAGDVMLGLKKTIGEAVMPILTQLATWFADIGPGAIRILIAAINDISIAFYALKNGVVQVWELIKAVLGTVVVWIIAVGDGLRKVVTGDFEGARTAIENGAKQITQTWVDANKAMVDSSTNTWNKITGLFEKQTAAPVNTSGKSAGDLEKAGKDAAAERYALAKAQAEADNAVIQDQLKRAQSLYDDAYAQNLIDTKDYYTAKIAIQTESMDKEIDLRKQEVDHINQEIANSQKKGTADGDKEVLKFRTELVKTTAQLTIAEANRAEIVTRLTAKEVEEERKRADQIESIRITSRQKIGESEVALDEIRANEQYSLGTINNEKLIELEGEFENRRNAIALQALQDRLNMEKNGPKDPVAIAQLNAQIEDLELQHNQKIAEINAKAAIEVNQPWINVFKTLENSMNSTVTNLLNKTTTFKQAMISIFSQLGSAIVTELITKPLIAKGIAWAKDKLFGVSEVAKNAAVAGSGAVSAMAGIPVVGPALAAAAGPATFAAAMAYAPIAASAEGGYDIPSGVNPMTQLHQKEMVLPAKHADVIRSMADSSQAAKSDSYHVEIKALDAKSVKQLFDENGKSLVSSLKKQNRNFVSGLKS